MGILSEAIAEDIVTSIIDDLSGRRRLGDEWDGIDSHTQEKIRTTWKKLIMEHIEDGYELPWGAT